MKFYHLSYDFIGNQVLMQAKITERRMPSENNSIPRISISKTIEGCVLGKEGVPKGAIAPEYIRIYRPPYSLYICDVPINKIYKPTKKQVPDCVRHGEEHREYWLLEDTWFAYVGKISYFSYPFLD